MLTLRRPEITRGLLMYRYRRLNEARANAQAAGWAGAMYPWQSGADGSEETPTELWNPRSRMWMPDNSHNQRHVSLDIAYSVLRYIEITTTAHSAIARLNSVNTCTRRICPSERDVSRDWTLTRPAASRSPTSAAVSPVIPFTPVNPRPVPLSGADGCADAGEGEAMAQNLPSRRGAGHPTRG